MPFGATLLANGGTRFRLWAPACAQVLLEWCPSGAGAWRRDAMERDAVGWHELTMDEAGAGAAYRYSVKPRGAAALQVPDPASRCNPRGVHDCSVVVDPHRYAWQNHGRLALADPMAWANAIIYELHIGTFTAAGTFAAAAQQLADLKELGVTVLQLMPLAAFAGNRNWGYDGVLHYAPAACYGSPDDLKALIDQAHGLGLMVFLDVVYNHFGPEGNYLHGYCPEFFNAAQRTPWGAAINFDGPHSATVRQFFIHNAQFWIEEYAFDGLRLDAVHAIHDSSSPDIVEEISRALHGKAHVVLEHNGDPARYLRRDALGRPLGATAQWDHAVLRSLPVLVTGEVAGYYADYATPHPETARSATLPAGAFIGFLQNHDMVGNRPFGERVALRADPRLLAAAYACLLLAPGVPMLFMGEEYAASTPFLFFCDFAADLASAVSQGRRRELRRFAAFTRDSTRADYPEPQDETTFSACKLRWAERFSGTHRARLESIRQLLKLRRLHLAPHLAAMTEPARSARLEGLLMREWHLTDATRWRVRVNVGLKVDAESPTGQIVYVVGVETRDGGVASFDCGAVCVEWLPAAGN